MLRTGVGFRVEGRHWVGYLRCLGTALADSYLHFRKEVRERDPEFAVATWTWLLNWESK